MPTPSVEQRRSVWRLPREIGQFWVDLHPDGLAVRPDVSDRLCPVHVVERTRAYYLDAGCQGIVPDPTVAVRAKVHGDDIAAIGFAVVAHSLTGQDLEILIAHDHGYRPCRSRETLAVLAMAIVDRQRRSVEPVAYRPALASTFHWKSWQSHPRFPSGVKYTG
jgi:hypothetical protein